MKQKGSGVFDFLSEQIYAHQFKKKRGRFPNSKEMIKAGAKKSRWQQKGGIFGALHNVFEKHVAKKKVRKWRETDRQFRKRQIGGKIVGKKRQKGGFGAKEAAIGLAIPVATMAALAGGAMYLAGR